MCFIKAPSQPTQAVAPAPTPAKPKPPSATPQQPSPVAQRPTPSTPGPTNAQISRPAPTLSGGMGSGTAPPPPSSPPRQSAPARADRRDPSRTKRNSNVTRGRRVSDKSRIGTAPRAVLGLQGSAAYGKPPRAILGG